MTRSPTRGASFGLAIALALGLALAALAAAPSAGLGAGKATAAAPGKVTHLKRVAKLNGQFVSLEKRVKRCSAAAGDVRAARALRARALRGPRPASVARLKVRKRTLSRAVLRLSKAARRCAVGGRDRTVVLPVLGGPGGSAQFRLSDVAGGATIDLRGMPAGNLLPTGTVTLRLDDGSGPSCLPGAAACVVVDAVALGRAVDAAVSANLSFGPLLRIDLLGLRAEVGRLLALGDVSSLLSVERVGDGLLRLVPAGPLALLAGVANLPADPIGRIILPG